MFVNLFAIIKERKSLQMELEYVMKEKSLYEVMTNDPVDLNLMLLKTKLVLVIVSMIKEKGWTQKAAAEQLNISQPRISNLFVGHLDKFSVDFLLETVFKLGYKMDLDYQPWEKNAPVTMQLKKAAL